MKSGVYFGLDAVGIRIWNLIRKPMAVKEIRDIIMKEYSVEYDRCERDLLAFLNQLAAKALIKIKNETVS